MRPVSRLRDTRRALALTHSAGFGGSGWAEVDSVERSCQRSLPHPERATIELLLELSQRPQLHCGRHC